METTISCVLPIRQDITYWFCFIGGETEIHKIKDDSKIKREKNIHRRGQRHIVNVWHLSDPPFFLTTFKEISTNYELDHLKVEFEKYTNLNRSYLVWYQDQACQALNSDPRLVKSNGFHRIRIHITAWKNINRTIHLKSLWHDLDLDHYYH